MSVFGVHARGSEAQARITRAYRTVFMQKSEDHELVLADLMAKSGWNNVMPSDATDAELRQAEGRRELFSHIFGHLSMSPDDVAALNNAARLEALADQNTK